MLRANRPILAFFDSIKALRVRQLALILKAGYDPNLMVNARGQNGLQFMIHYFGATEAHYRLQAPINKSAYLNMAKLLLDSGLDPNALDLLTDETVLFDAIRYNDREMVALLLNYVDPALRNKNGETALMCAARFGSRQVVRLLLDHLRRLEMDGYFLRQRNRFGLTALEMARAENLEAARVLAKHLVTYGHTHALPPHTASVLSRSVSHHQLASLGPGGAGNTSGPAPGPVSGARHLRRPGRRPDMLVADCLAASDFDYDYDLVDPLEVDALVEDEALVEAALRRGQLGAPHVAAARRQPPLYAGAYYDPKAAEFSQYLLEQQAAMDAGEGSSGQPGTGPALGNRGLSEEEDYGSAGVSGGLMRSRSCMLVGPKQGAGHQAKKGPGAEGNGN